MSGPTSRSLQDLSRALEAALAGPVAWSGPPGAWHQRAVGNPYPQLAQLAHSCQSNLELLSSALGWFSSVSQEESRALVVVLDEPLKGPLLERLESVASRGDNLLLLWLDLGRRYSAAQHSWLPFGQHDSKSSLDGGLLKPLGIEFLGTAEMNKPDRLLKTLETALQPSGPRLLHVLGPEPSTSVHSSSTLRSESFVLSHAPGKPASSTPYQRNQAPQQPETLELAVLERLHEEFREDEQLRVFWALPRSPGSLRGLGDRLRRIDLPSVLAEARGASAAGLYPVVAISAEGLPTLLPHLLGGIRHPLSLLVLGGGLSFDEGETHLHPGRLRDLAMLRLVNGLAIAVPAELEEGVQMFRLARSTETPMAIRLSSVPAVGMKTTQRSLQPGKAHCVRQTRGGQPPNMAILALGSTVFPSLLAAEALSAWGAECSVYDVRFLKPLDLEMLEEISHCPRLLTVEEHCVQGGLHTTVLEAWQLLELPPIPVHALGLPVHPPLEAGSTLEQFDLHAEGIGRKARLCLGMERTWS